MIDFNDITVENVMLMIIQIAFPIGVSVLFSLLKQKTRFGNLKFWPMQIIIGVAFGFVAVFASSFGVAIPGSVISLRDAAPICAGLLFGWPAALISCAIGSLWRLCLTQVYALYSYTVVACVCGTFFAGGFAAFSKKFVLGNRQSPWHFGIVVAIVVESFHMLLILITHMNDLEIAYKVLQSCAIPMVGCVVIVALTGCIVVNKIEQPKSFDRHKKSITSTFQKLLFIVIIVAFVLSFQFVWMYQSSTSMREASELLNINIDVIQSNINQQADSSLLKIAQSVKYDIMEREHDCETLQYYCDKYNIAEIDIVGDDGLIQASNFPEFIGFDMWSGSQSQEFMTEMEYKDRYVQEYGPMAADPSQYRKYASIRLETGGFMQVAYDEDQYMSTMQQYIENAASYMIIRETGFMVICNRNGFVVSGPKKGGDALDKSQMLGKQLVDCGIDFDTIISNKENKMFEVKCPENLLTSKYSALDTSKNAYCIYDNVQGYYIMGFLPVCEMNFSRNLIEYSTELMFLFAFGILFVVIYRLLNKHVIDDISKINKELKLITDGNLDVVIDVKNHVEFESLSSGINHTVGRLKDLIGEASARIDKELQFAKNIQASALPNVFPAYPSRNDFDVFASMDTAKEVGGDFYDFYLLDDNHLVILIADVSGKGIPAAMFMMTAKTLLKSLAETGKDINVVVTEANKELCENNETGLFITMWMAVCDLRTGDVTFVNAGHNPPVLIKADGTAEYLHSKAGFVLAGMDGYKYKKNNIQLQDGDKIFLYTDGITEAMNINQELYGEPRLLEVLNEYGKQDVTELCKTVTDKVAEFVADAPQADDMTLLCYEFKGEAETITDSLEIEATIPNVDVVTEFVNNMLDKVGCSAKTKVQIDVAIDELFSNIAYYAYGGEVGKAMVTVSITGDWATLSFMDNGVEFNPLAKRDPNVELSAEERKIGGLGIYMVKKSMDNMSYARVKGVNVLTISKKMKR